MRTSLPLADLSNLCIWKRDPRMVAYRDTGSATSSQRTGTDEVLLRFMAAATVDPATLQLEESRDFLAGQIRGRVSTFLMSADDDLDEGTTLNDIGMDSLMVIELRNWWRHNLGSDISVLELLNVNLKQLGGIAAERL